MREEACVTKEGSFKRAVRRHASDTGQRYTQAKTDLEGVDRRVFHGTTADRVAAHLKEHYGIEIAAVSSIGTHNEVVFRIDQRDGRAWVARVFPPTRKRARVEGDARILALLARHEFPAERLATDDAVSAFDGQAVLVTELLRGDALDASGAAGFAAWGRLLGRLHALPLDHCADREGGAFGHDPAREGHSAQDLMAAQTYLRAVDGRVAAAHRPRFEWLREQVREADDARGLPEALVHGDLVDHVIDSAAGPTAIHWQASGRGARLADVAFPIWMTLGQEDNLDALMGAYREHVHLVDAELDRLEDVLRIKPLYLVCWYYWRWLEAGYQPNGDERWWHYIDPDGLEKLAAAARLALAR